MQNQVSQLTCLALRSPTTMKQSELSKRELGRVGRGASLRIAPRRLIDADDSQTKFGMADNIT